MHTLETVALMLNVKCYPLLISTLGFPCVALVYSGMIALMTLWAAVTVKKTDGLTLVEVERLYGKEKSSKDEDVP